MYAEKRVLRKYGSRRHPRSGAGKIKHDGSNSEEVIEVKIAAQSFRLKGADLDTLFRRSVQQGKDPVMIVQFDNGIEAVIETRRWR